MKKLSIITVICAFVASSLAMFATSAWAVPVFARKYNVQCSLCHTLPPRLTRTGMAFKENGFELPSPIPQSDVFGNVNVFIDDDPKVILPAGLPLTLRSGVNVGISQSLTTTAGTPASPSAMTINQREFGLIGGGNLNGVGFWFDAPFAGANAAPGVNNFTVKLDFKISDAAKIKVGLFTPGETINYGLGLQPAELGGGNWLNPVSQTGPFSTAVASSINTNFGDNTVSGFELHGTTDAANLGFNYAVGYTFNAGLNADNNVYGQMPLGGAAATSPPSAIYGALGYIIDSIDTNIGVSYLSATNIDNKTTNNTGNTLLGTLTWNMGEPFQIIAAYSSTNTYVTPGTPGTVNITGWSIQPEYLFWGDRMWIGARYASMNNCNLIPTVTPTTGLGNPNPAGVGVGAPGISSSQFNIGIGYRVLQDVNIGITYDSITTNNTAAASITGNSGVTALVDIVL